jgi:tRNA pseudouridine32 synthase/23S rRNA pseudouridine746 synthase
LSQKHQNSDQFFIKFEQPIVSNRIPNQFNLMLNYEPHALCLLAAEQLQSYLKSQSEWQHNFGLDESALGKVIGKMFGILVVETSANEIGYLAAFSGKLADSNKHAQFVPPVFDTLEENGFLNEGMQELTKMSQEISMLKVLKPEDFEKQVQSLKKKRRNYSIALQSQIFDHYHFLNQAGEEKNIVDIFKTAGYKSPPAGAGECAGPKLLQYAFQHQMKPLAIAEFWWGLSPKSATWKHKQFYPCCKEKCEPILIHMLKGMPFEYI